MKYPGRGLTNIQKFFIFLTAIFIIAIADYRSFVAKSEKVELYDELDTSISSVRVSMTKLEYLLDMFVVARRFENTTVELIKSDVSKLDENITEALGNPKYNKLLENNTLLSEEIASISDDWQVIKAEIKKLDASMPQDEIMLIHNSVDVNTVLITGKADRLLNIIHESSKGVFADLKELALNSIIGFIVFVLFGSLIFHKKVSSPIQKAVKAARKASAGDLSARFKEDSRSVFGRFAGELNLMLENISDFQASKDEKIRDLDLELRNKAVQISALGGLLAFGGRSLSLPDIFNISVKEAAKSADAAAIYMHDEGALRLKASAGFDDIIFKGGSVIPFNDLKGLSDRAATIEFRHLDDFPSTAYGDFLKSNGFARLTCVPLTYDRETMGFLFAAFKDTRGAKYDSVPFHEAIAAGASLSAGHINLFQKELNSKRFLERIINQTPFGVAVFDKDGACVLANSALKRFIGADQKAALTGEYRIFEDNVFTSQGMLTAIKKTYEGFTTEFIINYDPAAVSRYGFAGPPRRLKIKSVPLYDTGGEISNIMLIYEEQTEIAEASIKTGETMNEKGI